VKLISTSQSEEQAINI